MSLVLPTGPVWSQGQPSPRAAATAAARPTVVPIVDRYARADRLLWPQLATLLPNASLRAVFTEGDKGLLYRTGIQGHRVLRYLDLGSRAEREIIDEARLAMLLAARIGKPVDPLALSV